MVNIGSSKKKFFSDKQIDEGSFKNNQQLINNSGKQRINNFESEI